MKIPHFLLTVKAGEWSVSSVGLTIPVCPTHLTEMGELLGMEVVAATKFVRRLDVSCDMCLACQELRGSKG